MVSIIQKAPIKKQKTKIQKVTKKDVIKKKNNKNFHVVRLPMKSPKPGKEIPHLDNLEVTASKKPKYVMPSQAVTSDLVNCSLNALHKICTAGDKQMKSLFDDEKPIFAEIHCVKIQNTKGNITFQLPHSTVASTGEVCLVTPDIKKGRKHDHEPTIDRWEEILKKAGVSEVKTILPMRQLRVEYDQFELKRRLLTQHDFIMVDTRVINHVSHLLGKMFFKKHNMLIPVRMNEEKDIKKSIDVGLRTAIMRLGEGETATVTIGHTAMPQEKIKENILALVQQLNTKYPGGEANIRAIFIKLPLSMSLPLYFTLRPSNTLKPPKLTKKRPKHNTVLEDELSTLPGRKVRVAPDGSVQLVKEQKSPKISKKAKDVNKEDEEENEDEELDEEEGDSETSE